MTNKNLFNALNDIDPRLIEKSAPESQASNGMRKKNFLKWISVAASFCLITVIAVVTVYQIQNRAEPQPPDIPPDIDTGTGNVIENTTDPGIPPEKEGVYLEELYRPYKNFSIISSESAIEWKWNEKTTYEQYTRFEKNGFIFDERRAISDSLVGDKLGRYTLTGYAYHNSDDPQGERYMEFDIYEIKNVSSDRFAAVLIDGKYYVFSAMIPTAPATLGELMDGCGFNPTVLNFHFFSKHKSGKSEGSYEICDDLYVWEVLNLCRDSVSVNSDDFKKTEKDYLSFTVTSESLGVYNHVMYITDDGYLWTNAYDYAYVYNIGTECAEKIISYALNNSTEAKPRPSQRSITGKVVEVTDEYVLINDGILCEDPNDGITFKVMLNDIRIKRYANYGFFDVNRTVRVMYNGSIDVENGYVICEAFSASDVIITEEGNILIPE